MKICRGNNSISTTKSNLFLNMPQNRGIIRDTTTYEGNRNPYSSGIFLPQIHTNNTARNGLACSFIEFAVRLRDRTKAEFIRTNKIRHSYVAVETVSHPIKGDTSLFTKPYEKNTMKTPQKPTALCAENSPIAGSLNERKMNLIHHNFNLHQNNSAKNRFQKCDQFCYAFHAVKSTAERQNSNNLQLANSSTPLNRAFFVRSTRTPQRNLVAQIELLNSLSMVACGGKGSPFAVFQLSQFLTPLHVTAQTVRSLSVTLQKSAIGVTQMYQFIFAAIRRTDLTNQIHKIRITAENELQARAILARDYVLVLIGRINLQNKVKTDRTFLAMGVSYA